MRRYGRWVGSRKKEFYTRTPDRHTTDHASEWRHGHNQLVPNGQSYRYQRKSNVKGVWP